MFGVRSWLGYRVLAFLSIHPETLRVFKEQKNTCHKAAAGINSLDAQALEGEWQWLQSVGRWRTGSTPASKACVQKIHFTPQRTFVIWKNDNVTREGTYYFNTSGKLVLHFTDKTLVPKPIEITYRFIGKNTLQLAENKLFRRNKHLFLRTTHI